MPLLDKESKVEEILNGLLEGVRVEDEAEIVDPWRSAIGIGGGVLLEESVQLVRIKAEHIVSYDERAEGVCKVEGHGLV